jgi:hypothetical protein
VRTASDVLAAAEGITLDDAAARRALDSAAVLPLREDFAGFSAGAAGGGATAIGGSLTRGAVGCVGAVWRSPRDFDPSPSTHVPTPTVTIITPTASMTPTRRGAPRR